MQRKAGTNQRLIRCSAFCSLPDREFVRDALTPNPYQVVRHRSSVASATDTENGFIDHLIFRLVAEPLPLISIGISESDLT